MNGREPLPTWQGYVPLDIGPETAADFAAVLSTSARAGTVIWSGTLGVVESAAFQAGSRAVRMWR